jgi:6,7-dimethyl-8-ribityllumazine synthase
VSEFDDSQDWPLRDFSARLRPPSRPEEQEGDERAEEGPEESVLTPTQEIVVEPEAEPEPEREPELPPPSSASEVEVLYDEDEVEAPAADPSPTAPEASEPTLRPPTPAVEEQPPAAEPEEEAPELETEAVAPVEEQESEEPESDAPAEEVAAPVDVLRPTTEPAATDDEPQHAAGGLQIPDGYSVLEGSPNGQRRTVAIVVSRFNGEITDRLLASAIGALDEAGVSPEAVLVMPVPGAFELPIAAMALAKTRRYSCVIALGCVIRGETPHFDFVAGEAASGLQLAGIETGVPVSLGLLTCDTAEQAEARVDRGAWAARTALEMADAFAQLRTAVARG